jgi:argininosuccinate lyase
MKFAPEYVKHVLNDNFEDAKTLLLSPLMAINYAHLVMLAEQGIISAPDARALRDALDGISLDRVREVLYDGTYEDLFFYIERLIDKACGEDTAGRLHTARSRNDLAMTMYRMHQRESIALLADATINLRDALIALAGRHTETIYGAHTHTQPA